MNDDTLPSADPQAVVGAIPSQEELEESIQQLTAYRDRLIEDVIGMAKRLKLPQRQVDLTLAQHPELERIQAILGQLESQRLEQFQGHSN